jgi:hypothetical protein
MTAKKDLKRRIRERQQKTGESYVAARRAVLAESPPAFATPSLREAASVAPELRAVTPGPIEVVEMDDFTEAAAAAGLQCTLSITHALLAEIDAAVAIARFREVLQGTGDDPALATMRTVALYGRPAPKPRRSGRWSEELQQFVRRVQVGIGGVFDGGTMFAMQLQGRTGLVMMVCHLGFGIVMPHVRPRVLLTTAEAAAFYMEPIAMRSSKP